MLTQPECLINFRKFNQISTYILSQMQPVPEWMFVGWIPQILSRFSFAMPCFLDALMIRLAKMYPSAMLFPFRLAYSQHRSRSPSRAIVQQIHDLLRNSFAEQFIENIECLNLPEKELRSQLHRILMSIQTNEKYTNEEYHRELAQTIQTVFENPLRGRIIGRIATLKEKVEGLLQLDRE